MLLFFLCLTYFFKHNNFRFNSCHKWGVIWGGCLFMFIFSCEGIVISVYPFSICCCPYLSFSQLTDACYFSFLGAAADIKNTDTSSSTLFLWIYAIMELLNHRVLNYPILQKKKKNVLLYWFYITTNKCTKVPISHHPH